MFKYAEDGDHGLLSIPRAWKDVGGGVCDDGDGYRANVPRVADDTGAMPGLWSLVHGGVAADAPLDPSWHGVGVPGGFIPSLLPSRPILIR